MNSENTQQLTENLDDFYLDSKYLDAKKTHREYDKEYEIIENVEQFEKMISHKYKVAWLNAKGKLCLRSYILLGHDRDDKEKYVSIPVINGIAQPKSEWSSDNIKHYSEIFNDLNLIFAGYLDNPTIISHLNLKIQKFNV